uniref:Transmembrane protein n=1 Tax=Medicago truncatula TaxID=3880 RepID=Q2HT68_MEDTR|nr:hypothetical protein MtrDRAFT_AC150777g13v1 [Medicago truncatula]
MWSLKRTGERPVSGQKANKFISKFAKKSYRRVFWSFPAVGPIFILVTVSESFQIVFLHFISKLC